MLHAEVLRIPGWHQMRTPPEVHQSVRTVGVTLRSNLHDEHFIASIRFFESDESQELSARFHSLRFSVTLLILLCLFG